MSINGLTFIEKVVSEAHSKEISDWFFSEETQATLQSVTESPGSRRVIHYGYKYNYTSGNLHEETEPMPEIISNLLDHVPVKGAKDYFNQCIINRYLPGQGISAHIDRTGYGDTIACFTFGKSGREMQFSRTGKTAVKVYTPPGSLYIMQKDARYRWKHSMKARRSDTLENNVKIVRKICFSVTFRHVPPKVKAHVVN